jgi:hypothetical protein
MGKILRIKFHISLFVNNANESNINKRRNNKLSLARTWLSCWVGLCKLSL